MLQWYAMKTKYRFNSFFMLEFAPLAATGLKVIRALLQVLLLLLAV